MAWFKFGRAHRPTRVTVHVENYGHGWKLRIQGWQTGDFKASLDLLADDPAEVDDFFANVDKVKAEWLYHHHGVEPVEKLIERSSLGTEGAKQLIARTTPEDLRQVREARQKLEEGR